MVFFGKVCQLNTSQDAYSAICLEIGRTSGITGGNIRRDQGRKPKRNYPCKR
jgi:hypothetical protein